MSLSRRAALQVMGAAALPAVARAAGPTDSEAGELLGLALSSDARIFRTDERATISAIADAILPRTATPGALDAGVPAYVEFITGEWMNETERTAFRAGLVALDEHAVATEGKPWPALDAAAQVREAAWAEGQEERTLPAKAAFRRLKGLTVQGYFVSERIQREVLKTNITPGRYFGCAPIPAPPEGEDGVEGISEVRYTMEGQGDA